MKKILIFIFCISIFNSQIFAQASGNVNYNNNTSQEYNQNFRYFNKQSTEIPYLVDENNKMRFRVNALSNEKADAYLAVFNVVQVGKTAKETDELINARIKAVLENLKAAYFKENAIFVDMISLVPKYEWESEKKLFSTNLTEVPVGFELQKNINIHYTDSKELDKIVSACADQEIYDLVKVDYFVNDTKAIYLKLRIAALEEMKAKIKSFETIGFKLDTLFKTVSEEKSYAYPPDRYKSYNAFRSNAIDYKKSTGKVYSAQKQTSLYYDPVSYKDFDIVMNPIMKEPMIQFSYSVQITFTKNEPVSNEKNIYILTPNGDLKKLDK